jgi:DNA-binding response OmpR family regulator
VARVLAVAPDLMFASRIEATLGAAGHEVELASSLAEAASPEDVELVVVDLDREPADGVVGLGVPVLGFYAHLNTDTREAAQTAGVDLVVPRSRMAREMPALVERLLA